ncbi:MAG TPA: hypothetical protein PKE55_10650 [Kiritimatiellia bacterium]|nr:hypothetical protein [Kiritimatiellia bacterium]
MNDEELKRSCLEHAGEDPSPEQAEYLARHPEVRAEVEDLAWMGRLMSLKRYEMPDPAMRAECQARVRQRIEDGQHRRWWLRLEDALTFHPAPVWAAALALLLVAGGLWYHLDHEEGLTTLAESRPEVAEEVSTQEVVLVQIDSEELDEVLLADVAESAVDPLPVVLIQVASNVQPTRPSGLQYGPGRSMPVSFGY